MTLDTTKYTYFERLWDIIPCYILYPLSRCQNECSHFQFLFQDLDEQVWGGNFLSGKGLTSLGLTSFTDKPLVPVLASFF